MAIVKNNSKGYGYNYASLSDIANQGYEIPKMKTESQDGKEFVFYYDSDLREWIRGAEIVIPESKGMNKAQLYGSALTYARRYTTLMALCLCCGDDDIIEDLNNDGERKSQVKPKEQPKAKEYNPEEDDGEPATARQMEVLNKLTDEQKLNIINHFGLEKIEEISKEQAKEVIRKLTKK